jgi:hypothetical protein
MQYRAFAILSYCFSPALKPHLKPFPYFRHKAQTHDHTIPYATAAANQQDFRSDRGMEHKTFEYLSFHKMINKSNKIIHSSIAPTTPEQGIFP